MQERASRWFTPLVVVTALLISSVPVFAEDLIAKTCPELMQIATNYHDDLKTLDTILGTAIEAGDLGKIKIYKLRKSAVQKNLDAILKAIDLKECAKSN